MAARNLISGTIPDSLRNLTMLKRLSLDGNPMHGYLPNWLGELTELRALTLGAMTRKVRGLPALSCYKHVLLLQLVSL